MLEALSHPDNRHEWVGSDPNEIGHVRGVTADALADEGRHREESLVRSGYPIQVHEGKVYPDHMGQVSRNLYHPAGGRHFNDYIDAALFSSTDEDGEPLDRNYTANDIHPASLHVMKGDLDDFLKGNEEAIGDADLGQTAHDFWLTRNRHGAGFWDGSGDYADPDHLTQMAHPYGDQNLYVGDDGMLHVDDEDQYEYTPLPGEH
jgi:hypothetical protein